MDDIGRQPKKKATAAALSPSAKPARRTDLFSDETDAAKEKKDRRLKRAISKARSKRKLFPTDDGRTLNVDANISRADEREEKPARAEQKSSPRVNIKAHAREKGDQKIILPTRQTVSHRPFHFGLHMYMHTRLFEEYEKLLHQTLQEQEREEKKKDSPPRPSSFFPSQSNRQG